MFGKSLVLTGFLLASAVPMAAQASEPCAHSAPRKLALDLAGVKAVVFEVASHDLKITAGSGAAANLQGRACASDPKLLEQLTLTQQKSGDKLVVSLDRARSNVTLFNMNRYAYLEIVGTLPDSIPVQVKVGSGDAEVTGAALVSVDVGSGDAQIRRTRGLVAAKVGSGDLDIEGAGSLNLIGVNSGDAEASDVRGEVTVGSIGSGDFELRGAKGPVRIGSIGSGEASLHDIEGNVEVESIGSGQVEARGVRGDLAVKSVGSGSVEHSSIGGQLRLPSGH